MHLNIINRRIEDNNNNNYNCNDTYLEFFEIYMISLFINPLEVIGIRCFSVKDEVCIMYVK